MKYHPLKSTYIKIVEGCQDSYFQFRQKGGRNEIFCYNPNSSSMASKHLDLKINCLIFIHLDNCK
jgi:hypothetical protein